MTASEPQAQVNTIQAINMALTDAMASDPRVLMLGEDVADGQGGGIIGITKGLSGRFGDRCRSTPISEQAIIGAAIGASMVGYRPVAEIMLMNFMAVAMDMVVNHAAKLRFMSGGQTNVPITIRTMTGSGKGNAGQHSDYTEAWFAHSAGIKVVAPSSPADAYGLLLACIDDDDPCIFIENLLSYRIAGPAPVPHQRIPLGKANVLRAGSDLTIVAYSRMVHEAAAAAERLAQEGVSAELIDLRTVAPWDRETVMASVARTGRAVIVHEAVRQHGVGAEIAAEIHNELFGALKAPIGRVGAPYTPVPFSSALDRHFAPDANKIHAAAVETMQTR